MHAFSSLLVLGACAVQAVLGRPEADPRARREGALLQRFVDSFISSETSVAWSKLLCNVGPDGCAAAGAASGVVVASPSKSNPDYWYTWTRDAALVLTGVVDSLARNYSATLQSAIQNYVVAQAKLQEVSNPSGSLADGAGLGEPKFMVDLTPFSGQWGRPQRDGPALRAIALARYAKWLIGNGYASTAKDVVWPVIKNDLAYIAQYWNETGFDLWEEVPCSSFFTIASNHRALVEGAALAAQLGTECRACITAAPHILCFQQTFWKADGGYVVSNINTGTARTGKDVNSVLASIHTFDPAVGCDATTFQPCSDKALSNHKAYVDSFRSLYPINAGIPQGRAVAVGRYAEDVYFNGNPWYLANFATAEQLYDAIYVWKKQGSITVTPLSLTFFQDLVPSLAAGTYPSSSQTYQAILSAVSAYADDFMAVAAKYTPADGSLAEQYDRATGAPTSAADLTWSYAAFLSAADRRAGIVPTPGWSAAAAHGPTLPSTCARVQVAGSYAPATAAASSASPFPPSQTPNPTATPPAAPAPLPSGCCAAADAATVYVAFHARVATRWGEAVRVVGSAPELGAWDPVRAVPLSASAYSAADPLWSITVPISAGADAAGRTVLYKYVKVQPDGSVVWESDPDRRLVLAVGAAGGTGTATGTGTGSSCGGKEGSGEVVPCPAQTVNGTWR